MSRYLMTINNEQSRASAIRIAQRAPLGTRVEFKLMKRSLPQNSRFWAMLSDVALQVKWCDQILRPEDWKLIFLDALKREIRAVPNLDGNGLVVLGRSSSDLTREEMSDLMELMMAFGAQHGVTFHNPKEPPSYAA
jgi:hypothetical protein